MFHILCSNCEQILSAHSTCYNNIAGQPSYHETVHNQFQQRYNGKQHDKDKIVIFTHNSCMTPVDTFFKHDESESKYHADSTSNSSFK